MLNEERLQHLLKVVGKQAQLLQLSWERLFNEYFLDENWVLSLTQNMEAAERLETFLARFNRMQDTLGDKLLPPLSVQDDLHHSYCCVSNGSVVKLSND